MIRFILVCIVVIGYLILSIPILLVEWIIGRFSPEKKDISSLRIIQAVFRFILKITGAKITVIGEENVPQKLLRHTSYLLPLSDPYRLHCQKRDGENSSSFHMDALSPLSLP